MSRSPLSLSLLLVLTCIGIGIGSTSLAQAQEIVDCSEYQSSHTFANTPITLDYVVTVNNDNSTTNTNGGGLFSAQVTYEGQGYLSVGFSSNGRMLGSMAVIGLPDEAETTTNPGKYDMTSYSVSGVTLLGSAQQTLQDATVVQNDTHTVLTFSKYLQEEGELTVDPAGTNFFLVAAGASNTLGMHIHRAAAGLTLTPCEQGTLASDASNFTDGSAEAVEVVTVDNKQSLFQAHGIIAALAWGILAPLAIANVMCRHLIPGAGVWFQMHRGLNFVVLILTTVSFAIAVKAINDISAGFSANHFESSPGAMGKHRTIGLVVFILVILQSIGGMIRPNVPKAANGKLAEQPSVLRVVWEYTHRLSGVALLAMAWYQCHSGFVIYAQRFAETDYTTVFWVVAGVISGVAVLGKIHGIVTAKKDNEEAEDMADNEDTDLPNSKREEDEQS